MRVLVFGKSGQVARELALQAAGDDVYQFLDRAQADLTDPLACAEIIRHSDADIVINAAAYTQVDRAEEEADLAHLINATTPGAMAQAAAETGTPFIQISTDYVFDGSGENARSSTAATAPINVYGQSKLAGEDAVIATGGKSVILRTSWVFSAHGANFVKTMLRLGQSRDQLSVVADQIGGPTAARDIAVALIDIARQMQAGQIGGTYHFAGQPWASWADFARCIFEKSGLETQVEGIASSAYPTPAARPRNSRLDCSELERDFGITPPDWRDALDAVLQDLSGSE